MSFPIEHPLWFLGLCAVLAINGWNVYKAQRFLRSLETDADVIPFPHRGEVA